MSNAEVDNYTEAKSRGLWIDRVLVPSKSSK